MNKSVSSDIREGDIAWQIYTWDQGIDSGIQKLWLVDKEVSVICYDEL